MVANIELQAQARLRHNCNVTRMDSVPLKKIEWLMPDRIPIGMLCIIAGQPGVGKTTISHSIAATVSIGGKWPFSDQYAYPSDVVILTSEDDISYTLAPRLTAAGADLSRIMVIQSVARLEDDRVIDAPFLLSEDMQELEGFLDTHPDVRLVILDPLSAYLGVRDSHRDSDVRQVLGPLTELAGRYNVAILGITHLSKNTANSAMSRFMGSTGIVAAARTAFLVAEHEDQLVMLPVKSNVAPKQSGLIYRIVSKTLEGYIESSCIEWIGQTDLNADDALAKPHEESSPKLAEAEEFLERQLAHGPKLQRFVEDAADREGISWRTIRRAKSELGIQSLKDEFGGKWKWYTPDQYELKTREGGQ